MAQYTISVNQQKPQGPSSVGDGVKTISYGETIVYTEANFTTETTPAYSHPSSEPAFYLKVLSLPSDGDLLLDGIAVTINQIITFSDIGDGLLTFVPDNGTTTTYNTSFNFQISDENSGIYVG